MYRRIAYRRPEELHLVFARAKHLSAAHIPTRALEVTTPTGQPPLPSAQQPVPGRCRGQQVLCSLRTEAPERSTPCAHARTPRRRT
jgi:hypothetical protein